MPKKQQTNNQISVDIAVMAEKVNNIDKVVSEIKGKLEKNYVTLEQFTPVKNIAYGIVSTFLLAIIGALVSLVLK